MWSMGWVADYPSPNDFLGHPPRDRVVEQLRPLEQRPTSTRRSPTALATTDPAATRAAFDTAEGIVRDEAPVIPLSYDNEWKLSRTGLLGAQENGLGITRMAGLAWQGR